MSSDRETTRRVRSWLEAGVTAVPDHVLDAVLDQVPTTPQRRPLWLARRYGDMSSFTRIGIAAAAVIVVVVAGTGYMLGRGVGSPASLSPSPTGPVGTGTPESSAAATSAALLPGEFTACVPRNSEFKRGTDDRVVIDGMPVERRRGFTWKGTITSTDERFNGTDYYSWDGNTYTLASGLAGPITGAEAHRIENAEGAWKGSAVGVELPDGTQAWGPTVLTGEGAYAGLTAVLLNTDGPCFMNFRGIVIEAPEPPVPYTGG